MTVSEEPGREAKSTDPGDDEELEALAPWQRIAAGAFGLGGLAMGTVATLSTENGLGSSVLLAIGCLLLLICITGRPPVSAKIGDHEMRFARAIARRVKDRVAEDPEAPENAELVEVLRSASIDAAPTYAAASRAVHRYQVYEDQVRKLLEVALPERAQLHRLEGPGQFGLDFLVARDGDEIGVEVKSRLHGVEDTTARAAWVVARHASVRAVLVVTPSPVPPDAAELARSHGVYYLLSNGHPADVEMFRTTLNELLMGSGRR